MRFFLSSCPNYELPARKHPENKKIYVQVKKKWKRENWLDNQIFFYKFVRYALRKDAQNVIFKYWSDVFSVFLYTILSAIFRQIGSLENKNGLSKKKEKKEEEENQSLFTSSVFCTCTIEDADNIIMRWALKKVICTINRHVLL